MKVLLVDDDQTVLALTRNLLVELGHTVISARDGFDGITAFARERPEVVFLDYLMPRLSGLEVLKTVKQLAPATYVVLVTAMTAATLSRLPGVHRADAVLEKPIRKPALELLMAKALRKRSRQA